MDELDRCRPDFAIRLIERVKHFFDIPKIIFILVMDKMQFSKVICHNYGYDEKLGEEYLDKFVDFTVGLNTLTPKLQDNLKINIYDVFKKLGLDFSDTKFECCVDLIAFYVKDQSLSKRSIIKLASQFALLYSEKFDKYKNQILIMLLINKSFLLISNDSLELYKVLLNQMDDYIAKNESDFSKFKSLYAQSNYSTIFIKAFFFYEENNISVFNELVDNFEQLNSSQKRLSIVSMRNLRPTENTDFLGSWKNYILGGI
ncbi:P-loop NTPase fold protein [Acinetobacter johnsonii]|uniref:P-loop NTPase fold protein n=1 Tax=Acinetobacter johnsonii TaxID=40214 RepID=UPI002B1BD602|nr:P-loop NTPase fold protein [Acinetobacter johnsonii]